MTSNITEQRQEYYFTEEGKLKDLYLSSIEDKAIERDIVIKDFFEDIDNEIYGNKFTFLRWLGGGQWFSEVESLYGKSRKWESRVSLIMTATCWSRTIDAAYELAVKALNDRSTQVISRALEALAYSLRYEALPLIRDLQNDILGSRNNKKDWLLWYCEGAIGAIEHQDHHWLISRGDKNSYLIVWPWDKKEDWQFDMSMSVDLNLLRDDVTKRLKASRVEVENIDLLKEKSYGKNG